MARAMFDKNCQNRFALALTLTESLMITDTDCTGFDRKPERENPLSLSTQRSANALQPATGTSAEAVAAQWVLCSRGALRCQCLTGA